MSKYKLNNGEVVDTSNFSEEEENDWLFDNSGDIDLDYDFQNGAVETDASATPANNPASNGDSISEDGLSDGVDRSEYLLTLDDIRGVSESDIAIAIGEKVADVGLATEESSTYQDLTAIRIKKGGEKDPRSNPINDFFFGGVSFNEFSGGDEGTFAVGEDLTDEELQINLDKFNKFILENADYDFVDKARERSNDTYVNEYAPAVKATDLSEDEQKSEYIEELVDKFEEIKANEETYSPQYGKSTRATTIADFESEKEFEDYKRWEKEEPISEIDSKTLQAWDYERREKEVLKNSGQFLGNLEPEQRLDILALAIDDRKAVARFGTNIKKFEQDQVKFEEAYSNYKSDPSNSNFLAAQDLNLKLLEDQSRLQEAQAKATASGLLERADAVPLAIADAQKNYNRLQQMNLGFRTTGQTVGFSALTLGTYLGQYSGANIYQGPKLSLNQVNTVLDKELGATTMSEDLAKETARNQYAIEVDDIRNLTDVGAWTMNSSINLAPSLAMASTGAFALPLFFLTGSGGVLEKRAMDQKQAASRILLNNEWLASNPNADPLEIATRQTQMDEDTRVIGIEDWRVLGTAGLSGAAEVIFEKIGTIAMLKSLKNGIGQVPIENMRQGFSFAAKGITKGMLQEGGSEFATTLVQNWGEIFILDGDKNLFGDVENWKKVTKGSLESFAQGALMGGGMSSINGAKGVQAGVLAEIATKEQRTAMQELVNKLSALTGQDLLNINNLSDLNLKFSPDVQAQIDKLLEEGVGIEADIVESLKSGFSAAELIEIGEINRKKRAISKKLLYASSQGLNASQLAAYKNQLQKDFEALDKQRETMLSGSAGKLNRISNKFNFEATGGYAMYSAAMLNESVFNINQNYLNQNKKQKQIAFDKARAKLKAEGKPFTEADVKKKAKDDYIYDAYYKKIEQGGKTAAALAESLGLDVKIISTNSIEETLQKALEANPNMSAENIAAIKAGQVEGMRIPGENGGPDTIIVDRNQAAINKRPGVFAHEVLHSYAAKKYQGDQGAIDKAGEDLLSFLEKNDKDLFAKVKFRIDSSYTNKNENGELIKNKDYYEEVLNAMSDVLADGQKLNTGTLSKIKSFANSLLEGIGQGPFFKEDQGKDAFIFVRDYNKSAHYGKKYNKKKAGVADDDKRASRSTGGNTGFSKSRKLTEAEEDRMEAIDEEIGEIGDDLMQGFIDQDGHDRKIAKLEKEYEDIENPPKVEEKAKPKPKPKPKVKTDNVKAKALKKEKVLIGDAINKMIPEGMTSAEWPEVAGKIIVAFQDGMLFPLFKKQIAKMGIVENDIYGKTSKEFYDATIGVQYIKNILNFKPKTKENSQGNDDFGGYIIGSEFGLNNRIKEALTELRKGKELNEASDVSNAKGIVAEESSNEVKEKPKYRKLTEAGVVASEVIDAIRAKLKSTLRTLKTRMDAAISNNRTVTPIIAEIQFEMGKQADIDLKKAMGGKKDGKFRKFLLKTKKAVLQNMTTTWLMGKDGQGGIPQAIQKKVDGKWLSYPAWIGKEVDREKTSTDNAGRTSGAILVRRHPNIVNYFKVDEVIDNDAYLAQFLDETGNPIRGRKEALAKAMGEEISFEIFSADLVDSNSEISKAFEANQERQGVVLAENFVQQLESDVDRGNIKFSISKVRRDELNFAFTATFGAASEFKRKQALKKITKRLNKEEQAYIAMLDSVLTTRMKEVMAAKWEGKEQMAVDLTNELATEVPGLTIKQKTTQKNPMKPDLVFSLWGVKNAWEIKATKAARLATLYLGGWFKSETKIKRKNVKKNIKDTIAEADQDNKEMKAIVDMLEEMYKTGYYINKRGERRKLDEKDKIRKIKKGDNAGNFIMPRWFYEDYLNEFYGAGSYLEGGAARKITITGGLKLVVALYNAKSLPTNYITFADLGDFRMGLDTLGLGFRELKGDVDVTIQFQPNFSGENSEYVTLSRVATFKMTAETANKLGKNNKSNLFVKSSAKETFTKASKLQLSITKQTAINNTASIKYSQTPKGISVFDFDDTLARTKSNVLYVTADGKKGKLNAAQFAARSETMLAQGVEFDFSEFSKVMKGELGPLFNEAKKKEGKYTNKDIFVLTARPANSAKAIHEFLKSEGLNIPLNNITGLGNGSPKAKADWMVSKIAEGYNDFYFADDHMGNVKAVGKALKSEGVTGQTELSIVDFKNQPKAVRDILNTFDVKGPTQRSRVKFSRTSNKTINDMLERASGIPSRKRLTRIEGAELGKKKGRFKIWMPSSLEDFRGLTEYTFAGKGRQGDIDQKFFRDALVTPYWRGINEMDQVKQSLKNGFAALNKQFKPVLKKLGKKMPGMEYTHDQAIRVYLWNKAGYEIPGLTKKLERTLVAAVQADVDLLAYANGALRLSQRKQWSKPSDYWNVQTILSDINNFTEKAGRKEYLKEFIDNADLIFSEKNLNKIEAIYGRAHREAIEDILYRMKNGTNRAAGMKKNEQTWNNWLNNSIGAIMFFNRRSALLQLLSTVNFVNWSDNNPMKAAAAFANQKQYWADFAMIFNSASLKQRRSGLKTDVNAAELASAVTGATDKASAALNYLLKIGFTPTQIVDSFAISSGGATLYRNRLNTYLKEKDAKGNPKYTQKEAEKQAFYDFSVISRETQQSGDPALISSDQSSSLGRVVLNFMNTPIQLNRSIKKSAQNIYNRRREPGMTQMQSDFSNFSKIIYYGTIQNAIFSTLQAAMFALIPGFNDDDEELDDLTKQEKIDKKTFAVINSMVDTTLKGGFGLPGAVVSILKNAIIEYKKQEARGFLADDSKTLIALLNISPAVGSKARKIVNASKTERFDKEVISERGWDVTIDGRFNLSPRWSSVGNLVEGAVNIPMARVVDELNSITEALDSRNTAYQRIALALGWKTWNVGAKNEENDLIEVVAKYRNKLKKKAENKAKKAAEKLKERRANIQY